RDSDEGRWLTYGELAALRRIDRHSAVKLVTRHQWRRQKDNHGVLRILVPLRWATGTDKGTDNTTDRGTDTGTDRGTDKGTDTGTDTAAFEAALDTIREAHAGEVAALRERAEAAEQHADVANKSQITMQTLAARLSTQLADAGERAGRLERDLAAATDR